MSDKALTQRLIEIGKPISGQQVLEWHLSLKLLEDAGWEHDRVTDMMVPPRSKELVSGA